MRTQTTPAPRTLVELLWQQAERHQDKVAFSFCPDGGEEQARLSYRELDLKARAIASTLQQQGAAGERVLLFCRPGLDSVAGFFGCVYAGAVAVPVDEHWTSLRIASIVPDARARFGLATTKTQAKIKTKVNALVDGQPLSWYATDEIAGDAEKWAMPVVDASTAAAVQYTSGTTKMPKGVVLTHHNFLHNLETIRQTWNPSPDNPFLTNRVSGVSWLPQFHDLGLVGGILATLYVGGTTVLMSPGAFLVRPTRWLEAMSRYRAAITAAPNFAYDWCIKRSTAEQRAALDLSHWTIALNGGEPVRAATLKAFAEAFAPAGFRPEAFLPVYGLAEATLGVSGGSDAPAPVVHHLDRAALGEDRIVEATPDDAGAVALVSCGRPRGGQRVIVVDPDTRRECRPEQVGEIWIAGPSVGQGYWRRPDETKQTFSAFLSDTGEGPFLRTGDRGFLRCGELFITGRCTDLIVLHDRNYYPNDIESSVQDCHPALLPGRGAAFSVSPKPGADERLVVVVEVHRHRVDEAELATVLDAVRAAVSKHHGIEAHAVVLVGPMRIPTTSSGKIQRSRCRQQFLDGTLDVVATWQVPPPTLDSTAATQHVVAAGLARLLAAGLASRQRGSRTV